MADDTARTCSTCRKELDVHGRCSDCADTLAAVEEVFQSKAMSVDDLVAAINAADGIDEIMDVLAKATPPFDRLEQQRCRERLLRAMKNKVSSPSKVVDAWLGSRAEDDARVTATQASELVTLVKERDAILFHTPDQQAFAALALDGHREVLAIRSRAFKLWLARAYWEFTGAEQAREEARAEALKDENPLAWLFVGGTGESVARVPGAQAITDAVATLEGLAIFDGDERDVHVRLAHFGRNVYLDLGNEEWEAVEITAEGWRIVDVPPVMFRRPAGLEALPNPVEDGSFEDLRPFLNVTAEDWVLTVGFIVGLFSPGPYPVLTLLGEMGSAKSTISKVIRRLVDPNTALLRRKPRSDHDLAIAANNGWVITADNLSSMPVWLSDAICTLATGGGFATRQLYSDADEQLFDSMRPVVLNGIGDIVARSDLLDRAILVTCPVLTEKKKESVFWAAFDLALPRILGAVLDAVSAAIAGVDDVVLEETPRMVDFAAWVTAAEAVLGFKNGKFLTAYLKNRAAADQTALDASPIGQFIIDLAETNKEWTGTATELLGRLCDMANVTDGVGPDQIGHTRRQEGWPKAANALSAKLHLLAPNLRRVGVEVTIARGERGAIVSISQLAPSDAKDRQDRQDRPPDDADDADDADDDLRTSGGTPDRTTCEICGKPGRPYTNHDLCDEHKEAFS
jgi:hypothetical protein